MSTTFREMQDDVLRLIALTGDEDARTFVKRALNDAAEEVWRAHPWRERIAVAYVNTVAPYTTGTVTVTKDSTAVTPAGATWADAMEGRKFALTYSAPYYVISTYNDSADTFTLARAYLETTGSSQSYVVYDDVLELTGMDTLLTDEIVPMKTGKDEPLVDLTHQSWSRMGLLPRTAATPSVFRQIEDSSTGATRIQIWPVPDEALAIRYRYLKTYTDMKSDGDTCLVAEARRGLVKTGAMVAAFKYNEEYGKAATEYAMFKDGIKDAVAEERRRHPHSVMLRPVTSPGGSRANLGRIAIDWSSV